MLTKEQINLIRLEIRGDNLRFLPELCNQAATAIDLQAEVDRLKAERRWIPVSDGSYPYDKDVLICQSNGDITNAHCELDSGHWYRDYDKLVDPTHWMPLPEPPKE